MMANARRIGGGQICQQKHDDVKSLLFEKCAVPVRALALLLDLRGIAPRAQESAPSARSITARYVRASLPASVRYDKMPAPSCFPRSHEGNKTASACVDTRGRNAFYGTLVLISQHRYGVFRRSFHCVGKCENGCASASVFFCYLTFQNRFAIMTLPLDWVSPSPRQRHFLTTAHGGRSYCFTGRE